METEIDYSRELLRAVLEQLGVIEAIRYPVFLFLTLLTGFAALIFVSDFIASRWERFSVFSELKRSVYSVRWLVISLSVLTALTALMAMIFPAGVASLPVVGDLFPATAGFAASVLLVLDAFFNHKEADIVLEGEDESRSESALAVFLHRFLWLFGLVIGVICFIHLLAGPAVLF